MQITIKIPMVTRSWFIIAFLAFMWGMVGKLIYEATKRTSMKTSKLLLSQLTSTS